MLYIDDSIGGLVFLVFVELQRQKSMYRCAMMMLTFQFLKQPPEPRDINPEHCPSGYSCSDEQIPQQKQHLWEFESRMLRTKGWEDEWMRYQQLNAFRHALVGTRAYQTSFTWFWKRNNKIPKNDKRKSRRLKVKTCFIDCNPRVSLKPIQRACLVLENIKQASTTASAATCGSSPPTWPLKMALKVGFHNSRATELRDDDSGSRLWKRKKLKSTSLYPFGMSKAPT